MNKLWLLSSETTNASVGGDSTVIRIAINFLDKAKISFNTLHVAPFSSKNIATDCDLSFRALPFLPIYLNYLLAGIKFNKILRKLPAGLAVGGSPIAGAIPFASKIPYGLWIATTLSDEYKTRNLRKELVDKHYGICINKLFVKFNKLLENIVLKNARFIICMSPYIMKSIINNYNINDESLLYIPFPIEANNKIINNYSSNSCPRLLAVGRVDDKRKNYSFLLDAMNTLIKKYPKSNLRIVGEISENSKISYQCMKLNLNSHVKFLGKISFEELQREYE